MKKWRSFLRQTSNFEIFNVSCSELIYWDTSLVVFLRNAIEELERSKKTVVLENLPHGLSSLLELSKDSKTLKEKSELEDLADDIEKFATDLPNYFVKPVVFIGAVIIALGEWLKGNP